MVLDELCSMSRFKGSKPVPPGAFSQPAVGVLSAPPKPAPNPTAAIPAARPVQVRTPQRASIGDTVSQSAVDNPLRRLGLYLAIAFIFCRFSLLGELVTTSLNFDPHIARILGIPTLVLAVITGGLWRGDGAPLAHPLHGPDVPGALGASPALFACGFQLHYLPAFYA